jgi:hypothetical protein
MSPSPPRSVQGQFVPFATLEEPEHLTIPDALHEHLARQRVQ